MSRSEQRGPLLDGTFDVLELAVPDLEAAGHQRTGAWTTMPTARSARAITNARMTVRPAAMRSGSFIGFARSRSNTHAESSPRGAAGDGDHASGNSAHAVGRSSASRARLDAHAAFDHTAEGDSRIDITERSIRGDIDRSGQSGSRCNNGRFGPRRPPAGRGGSSP